VVKLNEQRQIIYSKQSEILKLGLAKGEEVQIMSLDRNLEYPIIISANILYTSPDSQEINQEEVVQTVS
jgi:BTB/POZ domain-containing protein 13